MMADEATESPGIIAGGVSAKPVTSAHYVLFANKSLSARSRHSRPFRSSKAT